MANRRKRAARGKARKAELAIAREAAFISHERAKIVKANLARDNRETATLTNHLGISRVVTTSAYQRITDSFIRTVEGGGLRECLNLDRPEGMSDRHTAQFKERLSKR